MKKQLLGLALVCSLSAMGMEQFGPPAHVQNVKPTLKEILIKKYIDRQPLTKEQQTYLNKTGKRAIAAGLAALGIGAAAILGTMGYKHFTRTWDQIARDTYKKYKVAQDDSDLLGIAVTLAIAKHAEQLMKQPEYRDAFVRLKSYPGFENAFNEIRKKLHDAD